MKTCIALALLVAVASTEAILSRPDLRFHFDQFKLKFGKVYEDELEELKRLDNFVDNVNRISQHNVEHDLGVHSFRLGVNQFADMDNTEFRLSMNGYRSDMKAPAPSVHRVSGFKNPDSVDWRDKNLVTPVKNQAQCGSCWAFSAVASLEGQHSKAAQKLVSLSEQNLVDCSGKEGNQGCNGGLMDQAFQYVKDVGGLDTEDSYPYKGVDAQCTFNKANVGATLTSWVDVPANNETALEDAIANVGPISVAIDASSFFFQFYSSGILFDPLCSSTNLDHGVTAVGYGADSSGKLYYIVKNSWGDSWGEKGYVLMPREAGNKCGIATQSSYPVV